MDKTMTWVLQISLVFQHKKKPEVILKHFDLILFPSTIKITISQEMCVTYLETDNPAVIWVKCFEDIVSIQSSIRCSVWIWKNGWE